jgi:hypothetical protein
MDGVHHIGFSGTIAAHNAVDTLRGQQLTLGDVLEIK